jgi:hypothetical protein
MKHLVFLLCVGLLGLASGFEARASVFACLLLVIAFASLSRFEHPQKKAIVLLLSLAVASTSVGMVRFVWGEALQGISEARGRATSKRAVSLLREILFAQDALRRYGMIDPDGDKIGSAGRLGELCGSDDARGKKPLKTPPLSIRYTPRAITRSGPANEQEGYLLLICLPGRETGSWVTYPTDPVNEELAERGWVAYAWPAAEGLGHEAAYFINEHEEILETDNRLPRPEARRTLRLVGADFAPTCTDTVDSETKSGWRPWRGKGRRPVLPGDRTAR